MQLKIPERHPVIASEKKKNLVTAGKNMDDDARTSNDTF
jgi:hypothetical protein